MVQMVLADRLAGLVPDGQTARMFAQASGHAGTPATVGAVRALTPDLEFSCLPVDTWSRVPVDMEWHGDCRLLAAWRRYLNVGASPPTQLRVEFACSCGGAPEGPHRLTVLGKRLDGAESFRLIIENEPCEADSARVLDAIGRLTGRLHGFETHVNDEAKVIAAYRRLRLSRSGVILEKAYRWWSSRT